MFSLSLFLICVNIYIFVDGAAISPSGVQYVFNVPTDPNCGDQKALLTAIVNLQEQVTILSRRLQVVESNGSTKMNISLDYGFGTAASLLRSGVHYTHWGRKECNNQASLLYSGYMAKTFFSNTGGGIDYQCLPMDPEYTEHTVAGKQGNSYIQAVEIWAAGVEGIHPSAENHNDVACSVCESTTKLQVLMIPAKRHCPNSWHKQYEGYLMAERYNHQSPSNFVCVDKDVEYIDGGTAAQNSGYILPVETDCDSLPCPRYKEGHELSCVVCTK